MDNSPTPTQFASTPLITPERLNADPQDALAVMPSWVRRLYVEYPEGFETDPTKFEPAAIIVLGKTRIVAKTYSILQAAFMAEVSRFPGITIVTNWNGTYLWFIRAAIAGHPEDLTTLSRVFAGATEYDQTKVAGIKSDMRAENLRNDAAEKIGKDARQVLLGHATRIVREVEAEGRLPPHFTAEEYLHNLHRLLNLIDQEATGADLSGMLSDEEG